MKNFRILNPAWTLLKYLVDVEADLVQCSDLGCLRFHICNKGGLGDVVRTSTMKTLVIAGLLRRSYATIPTYSVSAKGRRELHKELEKRVNSRQAYKSIANGLPDWREFITLDASIKHHGRIWKAAQ